MAAVGLLSWVTVGKYLDHMPLYRLERMAAREGVTLAVVDALSHLGVRHIDMPTTPERVWMALAAVGA